MTTNAGSLGSGKNSYVGFESACDKENQERAVSKVKESFSPEFINRIDEIILFGSLTSDDLVKISENELEKLKKKAEGIGINLTFSENVAGKIASANNTVKYGARPIKRNVMELIENRLAGMIISNQVTEGDRICVELKDDKIEFLPQIINQTPSKSKSGV